MDSLDLHTIIEEFEHSTLSELELQCASYTVKLKRANEPNLPPVVPLSQQPVANHRVTENSPDIIESPLVGTFYLTPSPDAPPFIEVGRTIATGDVLCIIEAMKMMNQLQAEFPCEIVKVLAKQGAMVEFGQPLFEVRRI